VIQGAAAELFKMWAVTVRARTASLDARIVLCLHDELLLHVPGGHTEQAAAQLDACLTEVTRRWAPGTRVRFTADITAAGSWADAKRDESTGSAAKGIPPSQGTEDGWPTS
jgi:DNA polymerase-1